MQSVIRRRYPTSFALIAIVAALASSALAASPNDWPGFRGADGTGAWNEPTALSRHDAIGLEIAWKAPIGSGYAGVAVADRYVITGFVAGDDDVAAAFDRNTGKEIWRCRLEDKWPGTDGAYDGPIATPLIHDGRVFCFTPRGTLIGIDLKTGKKLWSTDLVKDFGATIPRYGFASSPIAMGGVVALEVGGKDQAVMGFDPKTGEKKWSVGTDGVYWQSPIRALADNATDYLLAVGTRKLMAINPAAGSLLWEFPHHGRAAPASSAVPCGKDRLFLHHKENSSAIYKLSGEGKDRTGEVAWDNRNIRKTYNIPVYHDGHIYAYSVRFLTCVDAETGESKWRSRAPGDGFMILIDGNLVIVTKSGTLHIAKASPDGYQERASIPVFDDEDLVWDHPAYAGDAIYVRSLKALARIDIKSAAKPRIVVNTNPMPEGDTRFQSFLDRVAKAEDKHQVVDDYLAGQKQFPIVEGKRFVHFIYRGDAKDVAVAGDLWGARQERPMKRVEGTDLFYYTAEVEPDTRASYQFIKDFSEMPDPRNPRKAVISVVGKDMEMSMGGTTLDMSWFAMPEWKAPTYFDTTADVAKGRIETHELETKFDENDKKHSIDVYIPAGYDKSKDRYPVAYVHGGDTARSLGDMDKALDGIIGQSSAPVLVVFIHRGASFAPGDRYDDIFAKEIVPFVDDHYRTIARPEGRASIGHGFAGFLAIADTFANKGLIGKVGCQSPFIFGSMAAALDPQIDAAKDTPITFYLEWGEYDYRNPQENWDMGQGAEDFAAMLKKKGFSVTAHEVHDGTDWPSWRNRYDKLFAALFPPTPKEI